MKKRILTLLLALALVCTLLPWGSMGAAAATYSGSCGENGNNVTWTLNTDTGLLSIQGSGKMANYANGTESPWYSYKSSVKTVTIASGVTSIGRCAFNSCDKITSVSIPGTVASIGDLAFVNCSSLTEISIPASLISMDAYNFSGCTSLKRFIVASGNPNFSNDSSGVLYNKDKTELLRCPGGFSGAYSIPSSVKKIDTFAFSSCCSITTVTVPASVVEIEHAGFARSTSMQKIIVNSGNPNYSSDSSGALFNKDKTELLGFPGGYSGSYTIPNTVKTIGPNALEYCEKLTGLTIPSSVTYIGFGAVRRTGISSITIPNSVTIIMGAAFESNFKLITAVLPSNLKTVPESLFYGCSRLENVTIPAEVTTIGRVAFAYCYALKNVVIPDKVTSIGTEAFVCDGGLTELTLGKGLKTIGDYAFEACSNLRTVTLNYGLQSIGKGAFLNCRKLAAIYIPDTVTTLEEDSVGAFDLSEPEVTLTIYGARNSAAQTYANQNDIDFVIIDPPTITKQPKSATAILGNPVVFTVDASGENLEYQWQYKKSGQTDWTDWSGATSKSLTVRGSSTNNGCQYRCVVNNVVAHTDSLAATLTVKDSTAKPTITTQPKSVTAAIGQTVTFKVVASGTGLKYQWQYKKSGQSAFTDWSGKTSASLPVKASATNGGCQYRCVVSNSAGSVTSSAATLTVTGASALPTITTQPSSQSTTLSSSVTFKVAASGSGLKYQWQFSKNNGSTWSDWSGKTSASLPVTASATNNGCLYRCKVSNSAGTVISNSARLTVTNSKPVILVQPKAATVAKGSSTTFKVVAWGSGLSYQWQFSKDGGANWYSWSGKTAASLPVTGSNTNNGCLYRCVIKNSYGTVTTVEVKLTVTG